MSPEEAHYQELVSTQSAGVYRLCQSILKNEADAADVTQEAFIRLWQHLPGIRPRKARSWLMRTARNRCLDRLRLRKPAQAIDLADAGHPDRPAFELPDPGLDPAQSADAQSLREAVMDAVHGMPETWKSVFVLKELEGFSCREISRICGFPLNSVKVYLLRARQHLRRRLRDLHPQHT